MGGFYDGKIFYKFNSIRDLILFVCQKKYRSYRVYAHFGGKYDFQFFLDELTKIPEFVTDGTFSYSIVCQGPKAIKITIKRGKNLWHLVDSFALLSESLDKLSKTFNVQVKKLTGAIDFKGGERVDKNNEAHIEYLEHDCISLFQILETFRENEMVKKEGLHFTIASQAMGMFRHTMKYPIRTNPGWVSDFVRGGYFGGRVEIFRMQGSGLNYYDVNSLFPSCMRYGELPLQFARETSKWREGELAFLDCEIESPGLYVPILPTKYEGKLLFPNGRFRGTFFSKELEYAISQGYRLHRVYRGLVFHSARDFFSEYVDYFYSLKQKAVAGSAEALIAKLLLNSLYGKFGQRPERQTLKVWEKETDFEIFHSQELFEQTRLILVNKIEEAPYMLPQISAAITSYSRLHMLKLALTPFGDECYYTDTDSVLTTRDLATGNGLGELKLEEKRRGETKIALRNLDAVFHRPKGYDLRVGGESVDRKMKGFPKEFIEQLSLEQFDRLDFVYRKEIFASLKRSLISNRKFKSSVKLEKRITGKYTKRRVLKNGNTEPWVLLGSEIRN